MQLTTIDIWIYNRHFSILSIQWMERIIFSHSEKKRKEKSHPSVPNQMELMPFLSKCQPDCEGENSLLVCIKFQLCNRLTTHHRNLCRTSYIVSNWYSINFICKFNAKQFHNSLSRLIYDYVCLIISNALFNSIRYG